MFVEKNLLEKKASSCNGLVGKASIVFFLFLNLPQEGNKLLSDKNFENNGIWVESSLQQIS